MKRKLTKKELIMYRHLKTCWDRHGKQMPTVYQTYILRMMEEYGNGKFWEGFVTAVIVMLLVWVGIKIF